MRGLRGTEITGGAVNEMGKTKGEGAMAKLKDMKLPGGITVSGGTEEERNLLRKRGEFATAYCQNKGWDIAKLTITQLLEIRAQKGWREPK